LPDPFVVMVGMTVPPNVRTKPAIVLWGEGRRGGILQLLSETPDLSASSKRSMASGWLVL
jgi:hypothetical protein